MADATDIAIVEMAWGMYATGQKPGAIVKAAAESGVSITRQAVYQWIKKGVPKLGIAPFKDRVDSLRGLANKAITPVVVVEPVAPPKERKKPKKPKKRKSVAEQRDLERQATMTHIVNYKTLEVAVAQIDLWRRRIDQSADIVDDLLDRAREILNGKVGKDGVVLPMEAKDLHYAATAVKVAFDAMKRAAETHEILKAIGGTDKDGRDEWVQNTFEGWSNEEHEAFRKHGTWPERIGPAPEYMVISGDEPVDLPPPEDSEGIEPLEHSEVRSSNIQSAGYDKGAHVLEVRFLSGDLYRYINVPERVYKELISAPSPGGYHYDRIRGTYEYERVSE